MAALVARHIDEMTREIVLAMDEVAALPLAGGVRAVVDLMLRAHAVDPLLHKVLVEQVPRTGRLEHIHDIERRMIDLVRGYLQAHAPELRVRDLELAAFVVVTSVEALTHAATIHHADQMAGRALADEITDLVVRYLGK